MPTLAGLVAAAALLAGGCASYTHIPEPVRAAISARQTGRTVELRRSYYYGDLYDENEKWLLSPYPFADTFHIVDTKGAPIHPRGQRGIIPAGTAFVVEQVEFPDAAAMARRMLTTPRYNTWVYLKPARESGVELQDRKYFILLLPMGLDTEPDVEAALARVLAPTGEVTKWLAGLRPTTRVAIEHKDVVAGMTVPELEASMGTPQRWFNDQDDAGPVRVAWYPSREAWLRNDEVVAAKDARPAEPVPER